MGFVASSRRRRKSSSSTRLRLTGLRQRAADAGFGVIEIDRNDFNHGRTRQAGAERACNAEILIYLTQDAIPRDPETFKCIFGRLC